MAATVDKIEILIDGPIQIRTKDDSGKYGRYVLIPGEDVSKEDALIKQICQVFWTEAKVLDYQSKLAERIASGPFME
jgi:hypothetical protein